VPRLSVKGGVYSGDAVVTNRCGKIYIRAFNTNEQDAKFPAPIVSLQEIDILPSPTESDEHKTPLWIVPKKTNSKGNRRWRMVIDYRALNKKTIGDAYPLPNITDILD